jgi:DNA-binding transcriptional MerR regulator
MPSTAAAEARLSGEALAAAAGISDAALADLQRAGVIQPVAPGTNEFTAAEAARLRRILRLQYDLELELFDATIIVDLLERLDRLEAELARWRAGERRS